MISMIIKNKSVGTLQPFIACLTFKCSFWTYLLLPIRAVLDAMCKKDGDCAQDKYCEKSTGTCLNKCLGTCPNAGHSCIEGMCLMPCNTPQQCNTGRSCNPGLDSECPTGHYCHRETKTCHGFCLKDSNCGTGYKCHAGKCSKLCSTKIRPDCPAGMFCDKTNGNIFEGICREDCSDSNMNCHPENEMCLGNTCVTLCSDSKPCKHDWQVCYQGHCHTKCLVKYLENWWAI